MRRRYLMDRAMKMLKSAPTREAIAGAVNPCTAAELEPAMAKSRTTQSLSGIRVLSLTHVIAGSCDVLVGSKLAWEG